MNRPRAALLLTVLLVAVLLAACGDDAGDIAGSTATPEQTQTTAEATPTAEATAEATEEPETTGGTAALTPIGSKLKIGEPAIIDYEDASNQKKSIIELTPEKIEKGSLDDFKNIELDEEQKKSTPYYVTVKVKNVGKGNLDEASPATYINGVDDRGQQQNEIIFFGDFERCDSEAPKEFGPGDEYTACLTYLVPGGGSIVGMRWIVFDEKTGKSDLIWE